MPEDKSEERDDTIRWCKGNWIDCYVEYNKGQESPDKFHLWCGLSTIAATLERGVYLDRGRYKLFPNLYVILISESAISRRSTAIKNASPFIRVAVPSTNFIAQKITEEKLYHDLHLQWKKTNVASGYLINDEITTLLGDSKKDSGLLGAITELYGCADIWSYGTLKRDKDVLRSVCFNILGGTAPEWLRAGLPAFAVQGGFVGRLIFVYQPGFSKRVAFPDLSPKQILLKDDLIHDLKLISKIKGEYSYTDGGRAWFKYWYEKVMDKTVRTDFGLSGYYGRKGDTVLKMGMVVAASTRDDLIITEDDLIDGLHLLEDNEENLVTTMKMIQSSEVGEQSKYIYDIIKRKQIQHYKLLRQVSHKFKASDVKDIIEGLIAEKRIQVIIRDQNKYYGRT